ncbi:MAG: DUF1217 domain-containing protein [Pseudomonadota bacterium]
MPFPPAIPIGGLSGFKFLERTMDRQLELFNKSPDVQREIDYFLETAGSITSVDQLMSDRRVLAVVLGAFGLDEDLNKGAFVRKVIEEGTFDDRSFANRLVDPAYREMSEFLGFGDVGGLLVFEDTRLNLVEQYRERQFELSVGEVDLDMRLALNFKREAPELASSGSTDRTVWLRLLGSPPLRDVLETALNLPEQFGLIELDQQVDEVISRARRIFDISSPSELADPARLAEVVDRFLLNRQVQSGAVSSSVRGSAALTLLQTSGLGGGAQANLFASGFV